MILIWKSLKPALLCFTLLLLVQGVAAFTVGSVSIDPSGNLYPGNSVNVSYTVYAAYGTAFPTNDDLEFITELDDPTWTYSVFVNDVKNTRPVTGGRTLTVNGFELGYRDQDEVSVQVILRGTVPAGTASGTNKTLVKIQELDSRGYPIAYSAVNIEQRVGDPAPSPTSGYGSITVMSSPTGADVFIDNVYKGLTPAVFSSIPNGNHAVLIRQKGFSDLAKSVTVAADNPTVNADFNKQTVSLQIATSPSKTPVAGAGSTSPAASGPASGYGSLSLTTTPAGALVYVDGTMMGVTPTTIPMLSEGPHSITLVMDGYQDLKTTITVNAGTTSEYITGLVKTTKTPGFTAGVAAISVSLLFLYRKMRK